MKQMKRMMSVMAAAVIGFVCLAQADAKDDARERRKARHAEIVQLVQSGLAAEGNDGYLVAKAGLAAAKAEQVKTENTDRKIGYEAIAKRNGKTVEEIGKKAAEINKARAAKN